MFKVKNEITLVFLWLTFNIFHTFSNVPTVDLKQVIACLVKASLRMEQNSLSRHLPAQS